MRIVRFGLFGLTLVMALGSGGFGATVYAAPPVMHLRSQRSHVLLGPFHFADGSRLRLGDEDYTIELPQRPGKLIYKDKTRFFRTITGLQPVSSSKRFVGAVTDELILEYHGYRELVISWDKIARIEITESKQPGQYFHICKVKTRDGKEETFDRFSDCFVEFDWTDSVARERCSLRSMDGAVIELGAIPTMAERE